MEKEISGLKGVLQENRKQLLGSDARLQAITTQAEDNRVDAGPNSLAGAKGPGPGRFAGGRENSLCLYTPPTGCAPDHKR